MTKHTPGPWEVYGGAQVIVRKPNRAGAMVPGNICTVGLSPRQTSFGPRQDYQEALAERAANARLIAAAPDLLAACRDVLEFLDNGSPVHPGCLLEQQIREAVARAEGSETGPGPGKDAP